MSSLSLLAEAEAAAALIPDAAQMAEEDLAERRALADLQRTRRVRRRLALRDEPISVEHFGKSEVILVSDLAFCESHTVRNALTGAHQSTTPSSITSPVLSELTLLGVLPGIPSTPYATPTIRRFPVRCRADIALALAENPDTSFAADGVLAYFADHPTA